MTTLRHSPLDSGATNLGARRGGIANSKPADLEDACAR